MQKILVVDDAKNIILVIEKSLAKAGYDVYSVRDGVNALKKARSLEPDLILLDVLLPRMNGFLILEALKEDALTENIPVIIFSAKAEKKDLLKARKLGASDYLVKPVKPRELLAAVEENIKGGTDSGK